LYLVGDARQVGGGHAQLGLAAACAADDFPLEFDGKRRFRAGVGPDGVDRVAVCFKRSRDVTLVRGKPRLITLEVLLGGPFTQLVVHEPADCLGDEAWADFIGQGFYRVPNGGDVPVDGD
jgi:hypothetical protein